MPQISKKKIKRKTFARIENEFAAVFTTLNSQALIKRFFGEFFTETEQTMLAKRLAVILMLKKGYSFEAIQKTLKLSPQTLSRYWRKLKKGEFQYILNKSSRKKGEIQNFIEALETILQAGLPPRGRGRWAHVFRNLK
ncbi:helix-turn-helix domain-containing protein [Candidatus Giovannonibacteria bacterium]|nr:helix-turn-helix domain-containing protein [Candidatus Giovannonibacteria bacterium]